MIRRLLSQFISQYKILVIGILVFVSIASIIYFHIFLNRGAVFTQFFYIPIILSALWWRRRGMVIAIILGGLLVISSYFLRNSSQMIDDCFRAIFLVVVSYVVAMLSEREARWRKEIALHLSELNKTNIQLNNEITERRNAEKIFHAILDVTTESIIMIDPGGIILATNEIGATRLGRSRDEIIGESLYKLLPLRVARSRKKRITEAIRSKKAVRFQDERDAIFFDVNLYPVFDEQRAVKSIALFARDITPIIKLQKEIITISENERQILGQDLHDDLGQYLTGIKYMVTSLKQKMMEQSYPEVAEVAEISSHIGNAIDRIRRLARNMCPITLDENGLIVALEEMCHEVEQIFNISCTLRTRGRLTFGKNQISIHLYYIAQESINNALKHGNANHIAVLLKRDDSWLRMKIENDVGYREEVSRGGKGIGVEIMKYRANLIGADIDFDESTDRYVVDLKVKV
jgi:PAS domain S-box-containing protein